VEQHRLAWLLFHYAPRACAPAVPAFLPRTCRTPHLPHALSRAPSVPSAVFLRAAAWPPAPGDGSFCGGEGVNRTFACLQGAAPCCGRCGQRQALRVHDTAGDSAKRRGRQATQLGSGNAAVGRRTRGCCILYHLAGHFIIRRTSFARFALPQSGEHISITSRVRWIRACRSGGAGKAAALRDARACWRAALSVVQARCVCARHRAACGTLLARCVSIKAISIYDFLARCELPRGDSGAKQENDSAGGETLSHLVASLPRDGFTCRRAAKRFRALTLVGEDSR